MDRIEISRETARLLLQIKAIILQPANPFRWSSGWQSPVYCDNRKILSFPPIRTFIRDAFAGVLTGAFGKPDVIAGIATGAIAHGALVADRMGLPFVYVRQEMKAHGLKNRIEGVVEKDKRVVVVEDLISTGNNSISAVHALSDAGMAVSGLISVFTYGFAVAENAFNKAGCAFTSLCDYDTLIQIASQTGYINPDDLIILQQWRENPQQWKPLPSNASPSS